MSERPGGRPTQRVTPLASTTHCRSFTDWCGTDGGCDGGGGDGGGGEGGGGEGGGGGGNEGCGEGGSEGGRS